MTAVLRRGAAVVAVAMGCVALYVVDPVRTIPLCPFRALSGLDCPFCGATRALHAWLHGDFSRAFGLNPLIVLAVPVLGVAWMLRRRPSPRVAWAAAAVLLLFAVARNMPFAAVGWMASYR